MKDRVKFLALAAGLVIGGVQPVLAAADMQGHMRREATESNGGTDGQPGKLSDVTRTIRLEARDTSFSLSQIQVRVGETVKFIITNKSSIPHEFVIANHNENLEHRAMMQQMPEMTHTSPNVVSLQPGETKELIWKFGRDKNVEFACNIPGHAEQGMTGTFRVVN